MRHSLTAKITLIFAISFIAICTLFFMFSQKQSTILSDKIRSNQYNSVRWLLTLQEKSNMPEDWGEYFANFDLKILKDQQLKNDILSKGQIIDASNTRLGEIKTIFYGGSLYLSIKDDTRSIVLANTLQDSHDFLLLVFFIILGLFIWIYISIFRSLSPLKSLRNEMKRFAAGNMDDINRLKDTNLKDEISEVAYEFNNAACQIKELILSRQLFLRAIMHELKTPIGKGRIISEMIANDTQKNRLIDIFERLNILISEFAKIEQVLSKSYSLNYDNFHTSLILEQVKDMMMLDDFDEKIKVNIEFDAILRVDFQLFTLAIKNLIDNALKYSDDNMVLVDANEKRICIKNKGKKLENSIEYYKQAFIREKGLKKSGLGLGLYIIDNICMLHKFKLDYAYIGGYHTFCVKFKEEDEQI